MFDKLSKIPIIAVPFLLVGGSLYHIAFWSKFDINGLSYLNASNIISSSIYPILYLGGFYIVLDLLLSTNLDIDESSIGNGCLVYLGHLAAISGAVFFYSRCQRYDWFIWGLYVGQYLSVVVYSREFLKQMVPNNGERYKIIRAVSFAVTFSFCAGKVESDKIFLNNEYRYTFLSSDRHTKVKFLGTLGEKYFFTDTSNTNIIIYNNIDAIELLLYKELPNKH
jgi:hypothetical protein